jgi:RepB DNA-primase N-terminal domain
MHEEYGTGSSKNQRSSSVRPMTFRPLTEADRQQLPPRDQWISHCEVTILPDRDAAERFLAALDPAASQFTFQTFDDDADRKSKDLARILHGSLNQHWGELCRLSASGAGVFVTINETNGRGRTAADVVRVRSLFVDLDEVAALPEKFHAEPHIISESSRGKWHAYWLVRDCSPGEFGPLQQRLIRAYGSDPKVKDLSRVLRVPGFVHQKVKDGVRSMPFRSRLVEAHERPAYAVEAAVAGLPEERERAREGAGQRPRPCAGAGRDAVDGCRREPPALGARHHTHRPEGPR